MATILVLAVLLCPVDSFPAVPDPSTNTKSVLDLKVAERDGIRITVLSDGLFRVQRGGKGELSY